MAIGAATANITVDESLFLEEDRPLEYTVLDEDGVAVNITGWTVTWTLRVDRATSAALITKTVGSGITLTTPASGILRVTIDSADWSTIDPGNYWMVLERTGSGTNAVLSRGYMVVKQRYAS